MANFYCSLELWSKFCDNWFHCFALKILAGIKWFVSEESGNNLIELNSRFKHRLIKKVNLEGKLKFKFRLEQFTDSTIQ